MQKFTVFTVLLTIVVVVVAAETFVNKYLPSLPDDGVVSAEPSDQYNLPNELDLSAAIGANVLGADEVGDPAIAGLEFDEVVGESDGDTYLDVSGDGLFDIEEFSSSYDHNVTTAYIRDDQVVNSGFVGGYLEPESYDGFLYKTISAGDLYGVHTDKYAVMNGTTTFAKVYILVSEDETEIGEVYNVLKVRASEGLEVEVNETNEYGSASFFMNDSRREGVAFLTAIVGSRIYGFSYPKQYHPQVRSLVSILMLDGR